MSNNVLKQPKAFYLIFMLEIWERFGYTALLSVITLYLTKDLELSSKDAFILFGAFASLIYAFIVLGGYLGDKILGAKRTILLGLFVLVAGYCLMVLNNKHFVYYAMALLCVGTGLFKSNPSSLLAQCYSQNEVETLHNAFTLFYMAINIGSTMGLLFMPILAAKYNFSVVFGAAVIGILLSILTFIIFGFTLKEIGTEADKLKLNLKYLLISIAGIIVLVKIVSYLLNYVMFAKYSVTITFLICTLIYIFLTFKVKNEGFFSKMILALILMTEAIVYKIAYIQMQTSINFYTINNASHKIFGIDLEPASFQALNPIWIIIMSPVLAYYYVYAKKANKALSIHNKFAIGMLLISFAFMVLYLSKYFANSQFIVSGYWLVLSYLLQSTGELLISALGLAMVAQLVPQRFIGFVIGIWWIFLAFGSIIGGIVASFSSPVITTDKFILMNNYTNVFLWVGILTFAFTLLMFSLSPFKSKLLNN